MKERYALPVTTDVVSIILDRDHALDASIAIIDEREENTIQELLGDCRVIEAVSNIGNIGVVGVELRSHSFDTVHIGSVGRGGDSDPPLICNLTRSEGYDVATGRVIVDLWARLRMMD